MVAAATYKENLTIGLSLKVIGSGATTTIIDGGAGGTVVTIPSAASKVTLSNLTIQDGFINGNGAGVNNAGTLTILNSTIFHNAANNGGGHLQRWHADDQEQPDRWE